MLIMLGYCVLPCVCVQVVEIYFDAGAELHAHEGKALGEVSDRRKPLQCAYSNLWGKTVAAVEVALVPLDLLEGVPIVVGDGVQAAAKGHTTGGRRAVRMVVGLVDVGMVIEVLY